MQYTYAERLKMGHRIYEGEITRYQATAEYRINDQTACSYMRMYRDANGLPQKQKIRGTGQMKIANQSAPDGLKEYEAMTK